MDMEEWRPVVGYEGLYEVSSIGRVRSLHTKWGPEGRLLRVMIRRPSGSKVLYRVVNLYRDGEMRVKKAHRLVAEAFVSNPNKLPHVLHSDGDSLNNCAGNLRWGSRSENMIDAFFHGTRGRLTPEEVQAIREDDRLQRQIAEDYGIAQPTVSEIQSRKSYAWVV